MPVGEHPVQFAVGPSPRQDVLERHDHDERRDADGDRAVERRPASPFAADEGADAGDAEPEHRVIRDQGQTSEPVVKSWCRNLGDRGVDGLIDVAELPHHVDQASGAGSVAEGALETVRHPA